VLIMGIMERAWGTARVPCYVFVVSESVGIGEKGNRYGRTEIFLKIYD
jgi:hypothetical protein